MAKRIYYKSRSEAIAAIEASQQKCYNSLLHIFRMPKGSRRAGQYAVCTYLEFINLY